MPAKAAIAVIGLSVALFAACLTQDGYYLEGPDPKRWSPAWSLLLFGWFGLFSGTVAWLANPLLLVSWVLLLMSRFRAASYTSLGALLFALSFLLQSEVISSGKPDYSRIIGYGAGYWLWIASAFVLAVGACVLAIRSKSDAQTKPRADELER